MADNYEYVIIELIQPIIGYPSYEISNLGNIYRNDIKLKPWKNTKGYLQIDLFENGIRKTKRVHRLVYENFGINWNSDLTIDHLNFDRTDNRLENLRLITSCKNASKRNKNGHYSKYYGINYHKEKEKWMAKIRRNHKNIFHKYFDTEEEAMLARNQFIIDNELEAYYELN